MEKLTKRYLITVSIIVLTVVLFWGCTQKKDETVQAEEPEETITSSEYAVKYYDVPLEVDIQNHIFNLSAEYGIHPRFIIAIIAEGSYFDPTITNNKYHSIGLMQIQPEMHGERMDRLSCTDLFDPYENITVGVDYLAELLNRYDGDIVRAIVAYQQGSYNGEITEYAADVLVTASCIGVLDYVLQ